MNFDNYENDMPNSDTFVIHDNSSEIAKFIPENYVEPLVIIARIQGFDGIDDYIIHLIKDRLEMFADSSSNDFDDSFQKYMHDMVIKGVKKDVPNTWRRTHNSTKTATTEEVDDDTKKKDDDEQEEEEEDLK